VIFLEICNSGEHCRDGYGRLRYAVFDLQHKAVLAAFVKKCKVRRTQFVVHFTLEIGNSGASRTNGFASFILLYIIQQSGSFSSKAIKVAAWMISSTIASAFNAI
jgi:hypothetical protein